jgi:hypothetical protein
LASSILHAKRELRRQVAPAMRDASATLKSSSRRNLGELARSPQKVQAVGLIKSKPSQLVRSRSHETPRGLLSGFRAIRGGKRFQRSAGRWALRASVRGRPWKPLFAPNEKDNRSTPGKGPCTRRVPQTGVLIVFGFLSLCKISKLHVFNTHTGFESLSLCHCHRI